MCPLSEVCYILEIFEPQNAAEMSSYFFVAERYLATLVLFKLVVEPKSLLLEDMRSQTSGKGHNEGAILPIKLIHTMVETKAEVRFCMISIGQYCICDESKIINRIRLKSLVVF